MPEPEVHSGLADLRKRRGLTVAELARSVGVTRQTVYAIEDGTYVPNTAVALRLARILDVRVEDIFCLHERNRDGERLIEAELLAVAPDAQENEPFVRLSQIGSRLLAVPVTSSPVYLPVADGLIQTRSGRSASIRPLTDAFDKETRLLLGGCDPALSFLRASVQGSKFEIVTVPAGSRQALAWLKEGKLHIAGSHILDRPTGRYNVPLVEHLFGKDRVSVVTFAVWQQGFIVQRGNPKTIKGAGDLVRSDISIVNREEGSGSRNLLETELATAGVSQVNVRGFDSIASGHLPAAAQVAAGTVDCCIGSEAAARRFGLDFLPLAVERFDLAVPRSSIEMPAVRALLDFLNSKALRQRLQLMAGYDTSATGTVQI